MMSTSVLVTVSFWRVLLERLGRQAAQTAYPVLSGAVAAGAVLDLRTVLLGLAAVEVVTLGKATLLYLASVRVTRSAPWWQQFLDRAVPAAAGTALAVPIVTWADAVATDWAMVGQKAAVAAVLAQLAVYVTPPALTADRPLSVARSDSGRAGVPMVVLLAVLALAAAALLATPASAHRHPSPSSASIPHVVARAELCAGVLKVNYDPEVAVLKGQPLDATKLGDQAAHVFKGGTDARAAWVHLQDDGSARVELHHVSGASGEGGRWDPVASAAVWHAVGKEITVRVSGEPAYDMVRVTLNAPGVGRVASAGVLVTSGCEG